TSLPDAEAWEELAARALETATPAPATGVPDGFAYQLTVDGRSAHFTDPHLTPAQRELVSRVLKEGA
ncbi:hypothetical protein G3I39_08105, partial [Streptomyces fulvissimus]